MMRLKLNVAFLAGLIGVLAVTGVGAHLVHGFQVKRNLGAALDRARKTEAAGGVPALLDTRAVVNLRRRQPEKALADLRQALAKTPEFSILHFHLAQAYHQSGNDAEAKKAFAQAERLGLKRDDVDRVERDEYDRLRRQLTGG